MKILILAISLATLATACGAGGGGGTAAAPSPTINDPSSEIDDGPISPPINAGDISACVGETPEDTWLFSSAWVSKTQDQDGVVYERLMSFTQSNLEVNVRAIYGDQSQEVNVKADINWDDNYYQVLSSDSAQSSISVEGQGHAFGMTLDPSTVKYSFQGPCLKIQTESGDMLFTPVEDPIDQ